MSNVQSKSKIASAFKRLLHDSSGHVTAMMGLSVIPLLFTAGAAIDYSRVTREQAAFYGAVDAAALAIAADERSSYMGLNTAAEKETRRQQLENYAKEYLAKDYKDASGGKSSLTATLAITGQDVTLSAELKFPAMFMGALGFDKFTLRSNATVKKAARPIEVTLVLDTTGSMSADMATMKSSAKKLVKKLYGDKTLAEDPANEFIRISLVPFSGAIRLNTAGPDFNLSWIDTAGANPISKLNFNERAGAPAVWNNYYAWGRLRSSSSTFQTWNGCVEMRKRGATPATDYMFADVAPTSSDFDSLFPAYFAPDTPSFANASYPSLVNGRSFAMNYINEDGTTPNETTGLTAAERTYVVAPNTNTNLTAWNTTNANLLATLIRRQENWQKYDGRNIGTEASGGAGPWSNCTKSTIVPMTYDREKVEDGIDAMVASGPTNIPEGLSWGRRVISPGAPFTTVQGYGSSPTTAASTISPYWSPKWQKVVVLMTDGENDLFSSGNQVDRDNTSKPPSGAITKINLNGTWYSGYGRGLEPTATNRLGITTGDASEHTAKMNADIKTICDQMKADGITIYTTTFRVTDTVVQDRVKDCATSPAHYKHNSSAMDLDTFFASIGETMNKAIYVSN